MRQGLPGISKNKIAEISFENLSEKVFLRRLVFIKRQRLASLLLDHFWRRIRQINDGGSMVKWVLATTLIVATTSLFASAEDHSHSQLSVIAANAMEERARAKGLDAINVEVAPLDGRVSLPKCGKAVAVLSDNSQPSLGRVTVGLRCQTPEPWTIYLRGRVTASAAIPVLQHPANRSELISEDDVVIRNIQIESDLRGIIIQRGQLVGKVAVRDLIAGQPLRQSDVKAPMVISRGQSVTIKSFAGGLTVTMKGKALGNARAGDRIWVQNERSKKRVEGIVSSSGDVLVQ